MKQNRLEHIERKIEKYRDQINDNKTDKFKFKNRKFNRLSKQSKKKPEYVLVQYLRNNRRVDFMLCKVISGNIIVVNNKGHELNPKHLWFEGKNVWYIIREKDTKPVSVLDRVTGWGTDDHPVLMKMVLGAVQKKEVSADQKKLIGIIIAVVIIGIIGWAIFGG